MPIHINVVCDKCHQALGASFGDKSEKYGDLISALVESGWDISDDMKQLLCSDCVKKREESCDGF